MVLFFSLLAQAQNTPPVAATTAPAPAPTAANPNQTTVDHVLSETSVTTSTSTPLETAAAAPAKKVNALSSEAFAGAAPKPKERVTTVTKFTNAKNTFITKFNAFLEKLNVFKVLDKVQAFVDKMKAQNVSAIEAGETGNFSAVVTKRRPAAGKAKEIEDKLDKLQADKLKKYDDIN